MPDKTANSKEKWDFRILFIIQMLNRFIITTNHSNSSKFSQGFAFNISQMKQRPTVGNLLHQINLERATRNLPGAVNVKTIKKDQLIDCVIQNSNFRLDKLKDLPLQLQLVQPRKEFQITNLKEVDLNYFTIVRQIGEGTFSRVYLAEAKYDKKLFAIKIINRCQCEDLGERTYMINEFELLKALRNKPFIAHMYYAFEDSRNLYLVMDYYPEGDFFQLLIMPEKQLTEYQIKIYFTQVVLAIRSVHCEGYIYCDLKPENILVDTEGYLRLIDFGFSKKAINGKAQGFCGSYEYMAPEMLARKQYSFTYDVFALGILLYEMLAGRTPYHGVRAETMKKILDEEIKFPREMGETPKDLITKMTYKDPKMRIGQSDLREIFQHEWFVGFSEQIKKISARKLTNPLSEKQILHGLEEDFLFEGNQSKPIGLYYNYLQPNFEACETKMGPKLSPTTN